MKNKNNRTKENKEDHFKDLVISKTWQKRLDEFAMRGKNENRFW